MSAQEFHVVQPAPSWSLDELRGYCLSAQLGSATLVEPSVIVDVLGGASLRLNADVPYYPACMIKVPLAVAASMLREQGALPSDPIVVEESQVTESAYPSPFVAGKATTFDELVGYALAVSDNTAANVLLDLVGRERGTAIMRELGMAGTAFGRRLYGETEKPDPLATGRNAHPPCDCAALFRLLASDAVPRARQILWLMNHSLPHQLEFFGLEPGDQLLTKEGWTSGVAHLAGVLRLNDGRQAVFVIYSGMPYSDGNWTKIRGLMRHLRGMLRAHGLRDPIESAVRLSEA